MPYSEIPLPKRYSQPRRKFWPERIRDEISSLEDNPWGLGVPGVYYEYRMHLSYEFDQAREENTGSPLVVWDVGAGFLKLTTYDSRH